MSGQDWLDSFAVSSLVLPYGKAAGKYLWQVSLGLVALLLSKHMKGDPTMNTPDVNDYMIAYPLAVPLWVASFVYLFFNLAADGLLNPLLVLLLFAFWLRLYQLSLTVLCEHSIPKATMDGGKETLPCIQLVKT